MSEANSENPKNVLPVSVRVWVLLACAILFAVLNLIVFAGSLSAGPLLDEQCFIGRFAQDKSQVENIFSFVSTWHGFVKGDSAGPVSAFLHLMFLKNVSFLRFCGLFVHWINAILIVLLVSHAGATAARIFLSVAAGLIFLLYPLSAETVFYLAGPSYSLSTAFFLASFLIFLESREKSSAGLLALSSLLFVISLLFDRSSWITSFVFLSYEIVQIIVKHKPQTDQKGSFEEEDAVDRLLELESSRSKQEQDQEVEAKPAVKTEDTAKHPVFDGLVPVVPYVIIGCIVPLGALPTMGTDTMSRDLTVNWQDWLKAFQVLILPVNWNHHTGLSRYYTFLVCMYILPLLSLAAVLINKKHKHLRFNLSWLFVWILVTLVPHLHVYTHSEAFAGVRWFYHCLVPLSVILATAFISPYIFVSSLKNQGFMLKGLALAACGVPLTLYLFYIANLSFKDMHYYRSGARQTKIFQASLQNLAGREGSDFVLVRNLPDILSIHPMVSLFNMAVFDGQSALLSAPDVSGGKLKKLLLDDRSKIKTVTTHFEPDYKALVVCDMMKTEPSTPIKGALFLEALTPPASYWKTGTYDYQTNEFTFYSNNEFRPTVNFQSNLFGISTDFVYIDAQISAPKTTSDLTVDMGWITTWCKDLEPRDRFMKVKALVNDDKYHRYYFPTDSTGWTTNGYMKQLTFSFPSSSKVKVKEFGCTQAADLKPQLEIAAKQSTDNLPYSTEYCYLFSSRPELGLCMLNEKNSEVHLDFDASNIKNVQKVGLEYTLCRPGKKFQPHRVDTYFDQATGKKIVEGAKGKIMLSTKDLAKPGFYALRLFAQDNSEQPLGFASDTIYCLSEGQKGARK